MSVVPAVGGERQAFHVRWRSRRQMDPRRQVSCSWGALVMRLGRETTCFGMRFKPESDQILAPVEKS